MTEKRIKHALMRSALFIHRTVYEKCRFRIMRGWWPDINTPRTVNEYLLVSKLNDAYILPELSGTYEGYLRSQKLLPDLKVPNMVARIEQLDQMESIWKLPDGHYILKGSHGSGMIRRLEFPRDRANNVRAEITEQVGRWLNTRFSLISGETCYDATKPMILIEELLGKDYKLSADIKIHCHANAPHVVQFIDRHKGHMERFTWIVNSDDETLVPCRFYQGELDLPPDGVELLLTHAVSHARTLCRDLSYVRIDFLFDNKELYFGEFTFIPAGACMPLLNKHADRLFYDLIMRENFPDDTQTTNKT